jgi:hypothetical protein
MSDGPRFVTVLLKYFDENFARFMATIRRGLILHSNLLQNIFVYLSINQHNVRCMFLGRIKMQTGVSNTSVGLDFNFVC